MKTYLCARIKYRKIWFWKISTTAAAVNLMWLLKWHIRTFPNGLDLFSSRSAFKVISQRPWQLIVLIELSYVVMVPQSPFKGIWKYFYLKKTVLLKYVPKYLPKFELFLYIQYSGGQRFTLNFIAETICPFPKPNLIICAWIWDMCFLFFIMIK